MDFNVARDKLVWMESADEIADFLESQGIVGNPQTSDSCAIANWMQRETGLEVHVSQYAMWDVDSSDWKSGEYTISEDHTEAIRQFTINFDRGDYPHLIDSRWVPPVEMCECEACSYNHQA